MKTISALLLLLSLTSCSWSTHNILMESAYLALHGVDYLQTRQIATNPNKYHENNPILGKHPSMASVNTFFITSTIIQLGIAHLLPDKYRTWFVGGSLVVKGVIIGNNISEGIPVK